MWVGKKVYQDLLAAHKREVDILAAWVEQLQQQLNMQTAARTPGDPPKLSEVPEMQLYISGEEEDLIDAHAQELIDDATFQAGMAELGRTRATIG